jgi:hypothetical protein
MADQETLLLWNPKVHDRVNKDLLLGVAGSIFIYLFIYIQSARSATAAKFYK